MERLIEIIKNIFKVEREEINDQMSPQTIPNWDSFSYLQFISDVEKEFKISFSMDEVLNSKNLGDIKSAMRLKNINI